MTRTFCETNKCTKQAGFGFKGNKPQDCGTHRLLGMIVVPTKLCKHDECNRQAYFGFKGKSAEYCSSHLVDGMINVKTRRVSTMDAIHNQVLHFMEIYLFIVLLIAWMDGCYCQ